MICPSCKAPNDDFAEACFTCGRGFSTLTHRAVIAGRYEVLKPLGRGGMGTVYKAHDRMLDETVAIKVLRSEFANTPEMAQRFRHEIKLARKVTHRNVCRIHEYGEERDLRYISMEFVEGADLKQVMRERGGTLVADEALELAVQMAEGLQAIHDVGIVHRDMKTANVMRDARGLVRLMDFGIAKIGGGKASDAAALTCTGQIMGTPEFMSPEQCLGETLDHRSDLYALGIVLYELLTGALPFRGDTAVATLFKHIQDPVPLENVLIPAAVPVLHQALAKNRADRYPSAADMAEALHRARQQAIFDAERATGPLSLSSPSSSGGYDPSKDRRQTTRLDYPMNLVLRRVGTLGTVLQEERTIAENVGRGGARVMTTMSSVSIGDIVHLEEVGGAFKTRAEVRGRYVGRDGIRRLNLRFESPAPDYLVHVDETGRH
jgi:serine/threonine protein kinase